MLGFPAMFADSIEKALGFCDVEISNVKKQAQNDMLSLEML